MTHGIRAHDKDINTLAVSPNDSLVASGSQDKTIRLWRTSDLGAVGSLTGHKRGVWKVAFSPVDRCLASSSADRTVRLWSMADYSCLRVFEGGCCRRRCCCHCCC
jgi:U3 small nucleolar RNA-associated protein 13